MLRHLIQTHRITPEQIARTAAVHPTTVRRWIRTDSAPAAVLRLIEIQHAGHLPSREWAGWTVHGKWLVDPEGRCYDAGEIRAGWLMRQVVAERRRLDETPTQLRLL